MACWRAGKPKSLMGQPVRPDGETFWKLDGPNPENFRWRLELQDSVVLMWPRVAESCAEAMSQNYPNHQTLVYRAIATVSHKLLVVVL